MTRYSLVLTAIFVALIQSPVHAQTLESTSERTSSMRGIPIEELVAQVAKKTPKKFVIDPRVRGYAILAGENSNSVDYRELLTILETNNLAAVEAGDYVRIIPVAYVRIIPVADACSLPVPTVTGSKARSCSVEEPAKQP